MIIVVAANEDSPELQPCVYLEDKDKGIVFPLAISGGPKNDNTIESLTKSYSFIAI